MRACRIGLPALLGFLPLGACSSSGSRSPDGSAGTAGSAQGAAGNGATAGSGQGGAGSGGSIFGDGRSCSGWLDSNVTRCTQLGTGQCSRPDCYATWTEVEASGGAYCFTNNLEIWGACDRYYFRTVCSTDFGFTDFYDKASGALTAFVHNTKGLYACAAGAAGVPSPADCPTDAGTIAHVSFVTDASLRAF